MKRRRKTGFSRDVKLLIWDRARGCCERCGLGLLIDGGGGDFHHRCPRGSGGTSVEWVNLAANGVLLCRGCHGWVETHRGEAVEAGWLVSKLGYLTAADVPVMYPDGLWRLDDNGGKELQHDRGD